MVTWVKRPGLAQMKIVSQCTWERGMRQTDLPKGISLKRNETFLPGRLLCTWKGALSELIIQITQPEFFKKEGRIFDEVKNQHCLIRDKVSLISPKINPAGICSFLPKSSLLAWYI